MRVFLISMFLLLSVAVSAAPKTMVGGVVMDGTTNGNSTGLGYDAVVGAEVVLVETRQVTQTDNRGYFQFDKLEPGDYHLRVQAQGFAPQTQGVRVTMVAAANGVTFKMLPATGARTLWVAYAPKKVGRPRWNHPEDVLKAIMLDPASLIRLPQMTDLKFRNPITMAESVLMSMPVGNPTLTRYFASQTSPNWLAFDPAHQRLYVSTNQSRIQIRDLKKNHRLIRNIPIQNGFVNDMKLSPDGSLVVATIMGQAGVLVIDAAVAEARYFFPLTEQPSSVTVSPRADRLYVTCQTTLNVIDLPSRQMVASAPAGSQPRGSALSKDGRMLYVANSGSGTVGIYDAWSLAPIGEIAVGISPHRLALTDDGRRLFVSNRGSHTVSVVETERHGTLETVPVGKAPLEVLVDGPSVYVGCQDEGSIYRLNAETGRVEDASEPLPNAQPLGMAVGGAI